LQTGQSTSLLGVRLHERPDPIPSEAHDEAESAHRSPTTTPAVSGVRIKVSLEE
jgi:hypothetical protein